MNGTVRALAVRVTCAISIACGAAPDRELASEKDVAAEVATLQPERMNFVIDSVAKAHGVDSAVVRRIAIAHAALAYKWADVRVDPEDSTRAIDRLAQEAGLSGVVTRAILAAIYPR